MPVNKITGSQVGRVTEPDRYMYTFGWLTIKADDLAVWEKHPNAAFTLIGHTPTAEGEDSATEAGEEFRLGSFDLGECPSVVGN